MRHLSILVCSVITLLASAQSYLPPINADVVPPTPQSASVVEYQMPMPSMLTGAAEWSLELARLSVGEFVLPIALQYHSNGIKVMDDPCPVGFGWALQPALRATRTILGRPDEHFDFVQSATNQALAFQCMVSQNASSVNLPQRYDSQHDIISLALPDAVITRLLDCTGNQPEFRGVDDEYLVSADCNLDSITVIAPTGVRYVFSAPYEYQPDESYSPGELRTGWALTKIQLPTNQSIQLNWSLMPHPRVSANYLGGESFMDAPDLSVWGETQVTLEDFISRNAEQAAFASNSPCADYLTLTSIVCDTGSIELVYSNSNYGPLLTGVSQKVLGSVVKSASISYLNDCLLSSIDVSTDGLYSFEYYKPGMFENIHSQDWWGYYNAKPNSTLTPQMRIRTYQSVHYLGSDTTGYWGNQIRGGADRSVDDVAMRKNLLKQITFPLGGYCRYEYEVHHFEPQRLECGNMIHPDENPMLSVGGGMRVKRIITAIDSDTAQIVTFAYPSAHVNAVPSAATFVDIYTVVCHTPTGLLTSLRYVNIAPFSNYQRFDIGAVPLWYDHIEAIYPQGKKSFYFAQISPSHNVINNTTFGVRTHIDLNDIFSKGPQLVKTETFKTTASGYALVESEQRSYSTITGQAQFSCFIRRNKINLDAGSNLGSAPDFDNSNICSTGINSGQVSDIYYIADYSVHPITERLSAITTTQYTPTGQFTQTRNFQYLGKTSLISQVVTITSDDRTLRSEISYPSAQSTNETHRSMAQANVLSAVQQVNYLNNSMLSSTVLEYTPVGSGFLPCRQVTTFHDGGEAVSPLYQYDPQGRMRCVIDADGRAVTYLWGYSGLYPVYEITGVPFDELLQQEGSKINTLNIQNIALSSLINSRLVQRYDYRLAVGVTQITSPSGMVSNFEYDNANRLTLCSVANLDTIARTIYHLGRFSDNYIDIYDNLDANHFIRTAYDPLGREILKLDSYSNVATRSRYDSMSFLSAKSVASSSEPEQYDWELYCYEPSPRRRLVSTTKAGETWHTGNHKATVDIVTNTSSEPFICPQYRVANNGSIVYNGSYQPGSLLIELTKDEDNHISLTFKDKNDRVVMTAEGTFNDLLKTRYIYDDLGRLRFVLPPNVPDGTITPKSDLFATAIYIYTYDGSGQLRSIKAPGANPHRTWHSSAGRLIAEQTPAMTANNVLIHFFDRFGRPAFTARASVTASVLDSIAAAPPVAVPNPSHACGYSLNVTPTTTNFAPLSSIFYDGYSFVLNSDILFATDNIIPLNRGQSALGLPTGGCDFEVNTSGKYSAIYYDSFAREIQRSLQTPVGTQRISRQLDIQGRTIKSHKLIIAPDGSNLINRVETFSYDPAGRVSARQITENGNTASFDYAYGSNGLLQTETMGNQVQRSFEHDQHQWLTSVTTTMPSYTFNPGGLSRAYYAAIDTTQHIIIPPTISYTEQLLYAEGNTPRFSGLPSAQMLSIGGRYDYNYDNHNRLIIADYAPADNASPDEDFSVQYQYNTLGAPTRIIRHGIIDQVDEQEQFGVMDNLSLTYTGAQLTRISAQASGSDFYGRVGYAKSAVGGNAFLQYDAAGGLTSDTSRGITSITYNYRNQPLSTATASSRLNQTYTADGHIASEALQVKLNGSNRFTTLNRKYYVDDHVFSVTPLGAVNPLYSYFDGGYFDSDGAVHYLHTDYRRSVVMTTDSLHRCTQHVGYYPYGLPHRQVDGQPRLCESQELQTALNLNQYRYLARTLRSDLALWTTPDPLAPKYPHLNPYTYCASNPITNIDPIGTRTIVVKIGETCYKVVGGTIDDDCSIYVVDDVDYSKNIAKLGNTTSITSFYNSDTKSWACGSIINTRDNTGNDFLEDFIENPPKILSYIYNARSLHKYDFKATNGTDKVIDNYDIYRGMPVDINGQHYYTSARDIGNIAAGFICGYYLLSPEMMRFGFDGYQFLQTGDLQEGISSQNAQNFGRDLGISDNFFKRRMQQWPFLINNSYNRVKNNLYRRIINIIF